MKPGFEDFLSHIQTDNAFYLQFRECPEKAVGPYELNSKERAALTELGPQFWNHLGQVFSGGESLGAGPNGDPSAPLKWRTYTTQTWWAKIDATGSLEPQFNHEAVLGRPEVLQMVAQIYAAKTYHERLAAVLALIDHIE
jgi:hypothetical protein